MQKNRISPEYIHCSFICTFSGVIIIIDIDTQIGCKVPGFVILDTCSSHLTWIHDFFELSFIT